jgi:hypothetical protein
MRQAQGRALHSDTTMLRSATGSVKYKQREATLPSSVRSNARCAVRERESISAMHHTNGEQ